MKERSIRRLRLVNARQDLQVDALHGALTQVRVQNGGARRLIRRQDEQGPVQPPRPAQRRIDVPGGVGGGQDVDAIIVVTDAVELFEELVDDTAHT